MPNKSEDKEAKSEQKLHNKAVKAVEKALINQNVIEDTEEAIIHGLDDD